MTRQKNNIAFMLIFTVTSAVYLSGCKDEKPAPLALPPAVAKPGQPVSPVAVVQKPMSSLSMKVSQTVQTNQFDFSNKKDPFKPDIAVKAVAAPSSDDLKKALQGGLPIHSFDVSQFRLIGIVTGAKENQAMAVDPNGKGYVLKKGMTIGKNDGQITAVTTNGVDIVEQFKDDSGRVRRENIRITLPRKQ